MALHGQIQEIVLYVKENADRVEYSNRLNKVYAGQLLPEIEIALRREFSASTVNQMIGRIPCINLLTRIVDKVSKIYDEPITRSAASDRDSEIIEFYRNSMMLDSKMGWANRLYNLHEHTAIEPYINRDGQPSLRVLSPDQFLMYSDDNTDPTNPTVFIKFMGDAEKIRKEEDVNQNGVYTDASESARVDVLYIYSATEFFIIDSDGELRPDLVPAGSTMGKNPLGRLPVVYINKSQDRLIPLPNTDTLNNTTLIPMLLGDLNFAVKYLSHSILVARDMDVPDNITLNPNTILDLKSSASTLEDGKQGEFEVISPKVDISSVIGLIQTTVATWLESLGIRPGTMGQSTGSSRTSALAKMVDEADTISIRNGQISKFSLIEEDLFQLISKYHEIWRRNPNFKERRTFSKDFKLSIMFPEQRVFSSEKEKIEKATMLTSAGLATPRQAIRLIFPSMTEKELDLYIKELEDEQSRNAVSPNNGEKTQGDPQQNEPKQVGSGSSQDSGGANAG